ncbi:MAG: hypothetical protein AAGG01_22960, partial [Planctomycetota bacterium]
MAKERVSGTGSGGDESELQAARKRVEMMRQSIANMTSIVAIRTAAFGRDVCPERTELARRAFGRLVGSSAGSLRDQTIEGGEGELRRRGGSRRRGAMSRRRD